HSPALHSFPTRRSSDLGKPPFDGKELLASGLDAMRRTIREQEPARPSTRLSTMLAADLAAVAKHRQCDSSRLANSIRGDLDWIVDRKSTRLNSSHVSIS